MLAVQARITLWSHRVDGRGMGQATGHDQAADSFRDELIRHLQAVLQAFAVTTPGYAHDLRSRWAYAFNPLPDGNTEKPVYATMAALRAPISRRCALA